VAWSRRGFLVGTLQVRGARGRSLQNLRPSLPHQAVMEIWGIPFCEACAREQEAYFDIGKLTMQPQRLASDRELAKRIAEAGKH
jgi:hypothetical protein